MNTLKAILTQEQKLARLQKQYSIERIKARKKDTRRKIELGGLVIKAKMHEFPKDVILGVLLDGFLQIESDNDAYNIYQSKGKASFMEYGEK